MCTENAQRTIREWQEKKYRTQPQVKNCEFCKKIFEIKKTASRKPVSFARKYSRYRGKRSLKNYGIVQPPGDTSLGREISTRDPLQQSRKSIAKVKETLEEAIPRDIPEEDTTDDLSETQEEQVTRRTA